MHDGKDAEGASAVSLELGVTRRGPAGLAGRSRTLASDASREGGLARVQASRSIRGRERSRRTSGEPISSEPEPRASKSGATKTGVNFATSGRYVVAEFGPLSGRSVPGNEAQRSGPHRLPRVRSEDSCLPAR